MKTAREVMQDFFGGSDGTPDDLIDIILKDREEVKEECAKRAAKYIEAELGRPMLAREIAEDVRSLDLSGEKK